MRLISLLAVSAFLIAGCVHGPLVNPVDATKAMIVAEATFNATTTAERVAKSTGALSPAAAARADVAVITAYGALRIARTVYAAGQVPDPMPVMVNAPALSGGLRAARISVNPVDVLNTIMALAATYPQLAVLVQEVKAAVASNDIVELRGIDVAIAAANDGLMGS